MLRSSSPHVLLLVASLLPLLITERAFAQGAAGATTADSASALYVQGKELREAGDLVKSLEKLEAAHALYATPITALEVGRARALVGKLRSAIDALESIERLPSKPNESAKATNARAEAKALLLQYHARIPKLLLRTGGDDVRVWVDGDIVPNEALGAPWMTDPGTHHVEAEQGGRRVSHDVRLMEGEEREVTLAVPPPPSTLPQTPARAAAPDRPQPVAANAPPKASPNVLAYAGFGVGAAGVIVGSLSGLLTLSRANQIKPQCRDGICPTSAGLDSAQTLGTTSTVSFVIGGVGIGAGALALVFARERSDARSPASAWVEPWLAGSKVGIQGGF